MNWSASLRYQSGPLELWTGGVKEKDSAKVFQSELLGWALGQLGFVHGLDLIQNGFLFLGNRQLISKDCWDSNNCVGNNYKSVAGRQSRIIRQQVTVWPESDGGIINNQ